MPGLDDVVRGGLPAGHLYLLEGPAGAGKTTFGLQFLMEGVRRGERVLWCSLSDTLSQLEAASRSHGWSLDGIVVVNLAEEPSVGAPGDEYTFFSPAEIELTDVTRTIVSTIERERPARVVFDPFSDVRLLARDPLRYRRQILQLRACFQAAGSTVLLIQESHLDVDRPSDRAAEGMVHGVFRLTQDAPDYGRPRRRLRILKLRGVDYREGAHDVRLRHGGLSVYPRLVAAEHGAPEEVRSVSTKAPALDAALGGGLDLGMSLLLMGPAGIGKSTLCSQIASALCADDARAALYLFDETTRALYARADSLGLPLREQSAAGRVMVRKVDPAEFSPGEFAHAIRTGVEEQAVRLVVIDSLNGYLAGMPDEKHLALHVHELLQYLSHRNVVTLLTLNQQGLIGSDPQVPVDISFLSDAAILMRYFETGGQVRRAMSIVKRRCGPHEAMLREFTIGPQGLALGGTLERFRGVLTGVPEQVENSAPRSAVAVSP